MGGEASRGSFESPSRLLHHSRCYFIFLTAQKHTGRLLIGVSVSRLHLLIYTETYEVSKSLCYEVTRVPALFITLPPTAVGLKDSDGLEWLHGSKVLHEHVSGDVNLYFFFLTPLSLRRCQISPSRSHFPSVLPVAVQCDGR